MISMNMEFFDSIEHGSIFIKSSDNGEEFLLHSSIVALCHIEQYRKTSNRNILLHNHSTYLGVTGICVDVERKVVIWITDESILGQDSLDGKESLLAFIGS
jgi:hypothetical protein